MNKLKLSVPMVFKSLVCALALIISHTAVAAPALEAEVSVNPVGDFVATIDEVQGFAKVEGDKVTAENIQFKMSDLKTGMNLRDKHSQKYLETDKFQVASLVAASGTEGKGSAKILFHGVEKVVKGKYQVSGDVLTAVFNIKLSDFGITDIQFKGAGVVDEVKVKVRIPVK